MPKFQSQKQTVAPSEGPKPQVDLLTESIRNLKQVHMGELVNYEGMNGFFELGAVVPWPVRNTRDSHPDRAKITKLVLQGDWVVAGLRAEDPIYNGQMAYIRRHASRCTFYSATEVPARLPDDCVIGEDGSVIDLDMLAAQLDKVPVAPRGKRPKPFQDLLFDAERMSALDDNTLERLRAGARDQGVPPDRRKRAFAVIQRELARRKRDEEEYAAAEGGEPEPGPVRPAPVQRPQVRPQVRKQAAAVDEPEELDAADAGMEEDLPPEVDANGRVKVDPRDRASQMRGA